MLNQTSALRAAATFRQAIIPAKAAADEMLSKMGVLLTGTATIALEHAGPLSNGQDAMDEIGSVITNLMDARRGLIRVHQAASIAGRRLLPELAWGDGENTEPKPFAEDRQLRAVG